MPFFIIFYKRIFLQIDFFLFTIEEMLSYNLAICDFNSVILVSYLF